MTIFEKNQTLGGVWASNKIYQGLTTNSPILTYEIPGFPYPPHLRHCGYHAKAQEVNQYLEAFAEKFQLHQCTQFETEVDDVVWDAETMTWTVRGHTPSGQLSKKFSHIVVCTGIYQEAQIPFSSSQRSKFRGHIWHSSQIGDRSVREALGASKSVAVIGAGKSALDLATLMAKGQWSSTPTGSVPSVKMIYRRPHWLSPRRILRGRVPFEKLLFSRFVVGTPHYSAR